MCIGKGAKVAGMEGNDKYFETFMNLGILKLARWRNCRPHNFLVKDVSHGIVDDESFGCKIYNSAKVRTDGHKFGQVWNCRSWKFWEQDVYDGTRGMRVWLRQPGNRRAQNWLGMKNNDGRSNSRKSRLNAFFNY
jgi:hypothetical protein